MAFAEPLRSFLSPEPVEGSLMKEDRDAIFKATGCSVATRDRGKGRCLSVAGPPDQLAKAREMALLACEKNQKHFEDYGQSRNPGNANDQGDADRVSEGYWRQRAHQDVDASWCWWRWHGEWADHWSGWPSSGSWDSWGGWPSSSSWGWSDWSDWSGWPSDYDSLAQWQKDMQDEVACPSKFRQLGVAGPPKLPQPRIRVCSIGVVNVPGQVYVQAWPADFLIRPLVKVIRPIPKFESDFFF